MGIKFQRSCRLSLDIGFTQKLLINWPIYCPTGSTGRECHALVALHIFRHSFSDIGSIGAPVRCTPSRFAVRGMGQWEMYCSWMHRKGSIPLQVVLPSDAVIEASWYILQWCTAPALTLIDIFWFALVSGAILFLLSFSFLVGVVASVPHFVGRHAFSSCRVVDTLSLSLTSGAVKSFQLTVCRHAPSSWYVIDIALRQAIQSDCVA